MVTNQGELIQAFELREGMVNLGAGNYFVNSLIHCAEAGSFDIKWTGGGTDTINCEAGQDYALNEKNITIATGKFHIN